MRYLLFCLLLALLATSCKKEATVWESDWNAPLINDTLSLANLVNDSTLEVSSGFYNIDLTRTLLNVSASELIAIPDTTIVRAFGLNGISLSVPPNETFDSASEFIDLELGDVQMKQIILRNGYIDVKLENTIETIIYFIVKFPEVSKDGTVFQQTVAVPAAANGVSGKTDVTLDLSGYKMNLSGPGGGGYNQLESQISAITDPAGDTTFISSSDVVNMEVTFRDNTIFYAQGYFGNTVISDTTTLDLSVLDVYQSGLLDISNLNLQFEVENGLKVGAIANLNVVRNENAQGNVVNLAGPNIGTNITVNPATGSWDGLSPSITNLLFNAGNSNIEGYLENLGVKHDVGYYFELNPWGNSSSGWDQIFPTSRVKVKLKAQMPLSIGMDNLVLKDTFDLSFDQDTEKTNLVSGDLILKAKNGFPFSADVSLNLLDVNGNLLHTIQGTDIIESSQYGVLDANTNVLVQPSQVIFSLSEAMLDDISDVKKIVVRARFNSPDPTTGLSQQMLIPENAFLEVKLRSEFKTENRF
ncbi:MAG: hypothetical protein Crog4KO_32900 [Crocinitomicaceae bacterium]